MNNSVREANQEGHYKFLVVAIIVGLVGVYVRFIEVIPHASAISNIILVIGVILGLRGIFKILE